MEALPFHERVILVGHSYGGYAISQAMEYFPSKISVAVFATAFMPGPTLNYSTLNQMVLLGTFFQMIFFFNDKVQYNIIRSNRSKGNPITLAISLQQNSLLFKIPLRFRPKSAY